MDLSTFLEQRQSDWKRLETVLERVEGSGLASLDDDQAVEFGRLYRRAASDLNQAQTFVTGDLTVRYLNDLVARAYLVIYGKTPFHVWPFLQKMVLGYPAVFRRHFLYVLLATLLFFAGGLFGYLASSYDRDLARAYLMPAGMPVIQPRGEDEDDPTPMQSTGEFAAFSSQLFTNNLGVCFISFALGITLGIGTIWLLFYNGILMGVIAAIFIEARQIRTLATGILPHGVLEIPAILIGSAAGLVLAHGFLRARPWPRLEELARMGKQALWLLWGCVPLMAVAALLEAGVARAPDWAIASGLKLTVAAIFALLFVAYLVLPGWRTAAEEERRP
jgi:uncharacterized membrane protein SpoIIM required for sporulation